MSAPFKAAPDKAPLWSQVYAEIEAVSRLVSPTANIAGPAYGAAMCDRALRAERQIEHLRAGVERVAWDRDGVYLRQNGNGDDNGIAAYRRRRVSPAEARAGLGDEAHWRHVFDSPNGPDPCGYVPRRRWPALSAIEHQRLGLRLEESQERLERVLDLLCRRLGKHHDDVAKRAPKAARAIARLKASLDGARQ